MSRKTKHFRRFITWAANALCELAYGKSAIVLQGERDYANGKISAVVLTLEDLRARAIRVWKEHGHTLDGQPKDTPEWLALQEAIERLE